MRLSFYGAAGEVTGSCTLLETDRARVLIDFGLHQGGPKSEARNRRFPPIHPERLDAVVLSHAHLDHSGRLPLLEQHGYRGRVHATPATIDLCAILLEDAAQIQESEAERLSRKRSRLGRHGAAPLYATADARLALRRFAPLPYEREQEIAPGVTVRFVDAGHILGSASVLVTARDGTGDKTIAFSADIGVRGTPLLRDPVRFDRADALVLESTYGDRDHRPLDATLDEFVSIITSARAQGGKILIPAFAVGRTQTLIYHLGELKRRGRLDGTIVYIDSPMAVETTELYRRHRALFDEGAWAIIDSGESPLRFPGLRFVRTSEESMAINRMDGGVIVVSAAGMMTGGRILHHLKHSLWKPTTHLVIVGYQAEGTLGRRIVDGARFVTVMGEPVRVGAAVHTLGGFSAHADQRGLLDWAAPLARCSPRVFLNHGEDRQRAALAQQLRSELGLKAELPSFAQVVDL
ncbi:MAG TPA: MBL fold metallo-hydrolase [Phycisphaerales bacterium]|nr:MBL fold metallo-hydrolase [Phycisphaerales bacterium]